MVFEVGDGWPSSEGQELEVPPPKSSYGFPEAGGRVFRSSSRTSSTLFRTRSSDRSTASVSVKAARSAMWRSLSGNVKLAMSHVVPDLVQKVIKGQDPLHILGSGTQVRHYTYAGDFARGIVTAMESPAALNDDFNLSTRESTTVLTLAEKIWHRIKGD